MTLTRTRIKICGVCRPEDAAAASAAGADAIGMAFYARAPRCVTIDRAKEILSALPAFVTPVGIFVNASADEIRDTARALGLRHVQLNGDEAPDIVAALAPLVIIKAVHVEPERFRNTLARWRDAARSLRLTNLKGLVLETAGTGQAGGTGIANDWETVRRYRVSGEFAALPPIIAAGGLTPESVGAVVRDVRPWAVDVSSGVEESLGRKSVERIRAFVAAVLAADGAERGTR